MIVKLAGCVAKASAALFTAIVAPIVVNYAVMHMKDGGFDVTRAENISAATAVHASPGERDIVVCHGTGRTALEARRDALRNAVSQVIALVDDSAGKGTAGILAQPEAFVVRCEELGDCTDRHEGDSLVRREFLAEVARGPLVDKLRHMDAKGSPGAKCVALRTEGSACLLP